MVPEMARMTAYDSFYSFFRRTVKGIHGTAIFTKRDVVVPVKAEEGIGSGLLLSTMKSEERIGGYPLCGEVDLEYGVMKDLDAEGRTTVVDCGMFVLINLCVLESLPFPSARLGAVADEILAGTARTRRMRTACSSRTTSTAWSISEFAT